MHINLTLGHTVIVITHRGYVSKYNFFSLGLICFSDHGEKKNGFLYLGLHPDCFKEQHLLTYYGIKQYLYIVTKPVYL